MPVTEGLKNSLNAIRELSSEIYHRYIPIIDDSTDISVFASPVLENPEIQNEFISTLINRIVYTQFEIKYYRNPLQVLEGDRIPLGYAGQEIYINPAKGRKFNSEDFAGVLSKYESDVKVQYMNLNMDTQYPVSIQRQTLKKAFVSWGDLETFVDQLSNSLYNGAYIDEYKFTKNIVGGAYKDNKCIISQITAPTTEALAKTFITKARELYLNFQTPSSNFNSWNKMGGAGKPIITWSNPEDIVFVLRNDIRAFVDVNVLASAFNRDKTDLLGNIITVDNFDAYDDEGTKIFDGSAVVGMIADKSWFRIKKQDMFLDTTYNPNNRTFQYFLNLIKMYNFSLFANGVVFATALPTVLTTDLSVSKTALVEGVNTVVVATVPVTSTQDVRVGAISDANVTATISGKTLTVTVGAEAVSGFTIALTSGTVTKTFTFTIA